jgi:hypothetical protein
MDRAKEVYRFDRGLARGLSRHSYPLCGLAGLAMWSSLIGGAVVARIYPRHTQFDDDPSGPARRARTIASWLIVTSLLLNLVEFGCSSFTRWLVKSQIQGRAQYDSFLRAMREAVPQICLHVVCRKTVKWESQVTYWVPPQSEESHWEGSYRYDSDGNRVAEGHYVVTQRASPGYYKTDTVQHQEGPDTVCDETEALRYRSLVDATEAPELAGAVTRLSVRKEYAGADERSCAALAAQAEALADRHCHQDYTTGSDPRKYHSFRTTTRTSFEIRGLLDSLLVLHDDLGGVLPLWIEHRVVSYCVLSGLGLGWFYRVWFKGVSEKGTVVVRKLLVAG